MPVDQPTPCPTDSLALQHRKDITTIASTTRAAEQAFKMAGKTIEDIHLAEIHDCFTSAEVMVTEALGLVEKGHGGKAIESGMTAIGGKLPVNASATTTALGHCPKLVPRRRSRRAGLDNKGAPERVRPFCWGDTDETHAPLIDNRGTLQQRYRQRESRP